MGGRAITGSTETEGTDLRYKRTYVDGPMYAPVTGYASQAQGMTLLEKTYDGILTGKDDRLAFQRFADVVSGEGRRAGSVVTTIDPKAQKAAWKGLTDLKGARGAVVALDPATGKVLAMVSAPSYDPSVFAGSTFKESDRFVALDKKKNKPLANARAAGDLPAGLHLQDPHRGRRAGARGRHRCRRPYRRRLPVSPCRSPATRSAARPATRSATRPR